MSISDMKQPPAATRDDASSLREKPDHDDHHDSRSLSSRMTMAVEVTHKVYGKHSKWFLFISLGFAACIYSLDGTTTWNYLAFAAPNSETMVLSAWFIFELILDVLVAYGKPVIAKIADVSSRRTSYVIVRNPLLCRQIHIIASANNIQTVAGGIIYAVSSSPTSPPSNSVVLSPASCRSPSLSTPSLDPTSQPMSSLVLGEDGDVDGMFAILVPVALRPLWEFKFAKFPVIARRFVMNRTVVCAALIGSLDFISYIANTYLYSLIIVVKPWSLVNATYFSQTQTITLTVFGISANLAMRYLHSYKWLLVGGLAVCLLGCGLMIHFRGANSSDTEIVWTQLLHGIGGGFATVFIQVAAQASVLHIDVGMVTAIVLLITEIGVAIGIAIAGAI
ncbi:hypothetical protein BDQ12DRAFT_728565 [Crucibulum laeve]|uniref:Major facilitator superfamily domain-containing protein n=1 Tax=Crucibulum laeve TaxID=68775 RepID=A0A5C3LIR9_9AGAR|nr:hypothetical protein BDQ12DRAFT_728565 [Crucibulum laeve]